MNKCISYIYSVGAAFASLGKGMFRTLSSMVHPSRILTQQYPENRETTLYIPERFQARLHLISDENGYKCTACTLCQTACPNGTIQITTKTGITPEGKNKRILDQYIYNLGQCTFCGQCMDSCNFGALEFTNQFENSEYNKRKLIKILNECKTPDQKEEQI